MKRALILGGTGVLGIAAAERLLAAGWQVDLTGRNPTKMPASLLSAGGRFIASDRTNHTELAHAIGHGANLVLDAACYTPADAQLLLPHLSSIDSTVMLSSKAVYIDAFGNHVNSETPPRFETPITESAPTLAPAHDDYRSATGYGTNKIAAEHVLLDAGANVTIIRPSKVHGAHAANPREWVFVKRILDRRPAIFLANSGRGADHTTAATNTAALIETVAAQPGTRILNSADPDAPNARTIALTIATYLGHQWQEILLDDASCANHLPIDDDDVAPLGDHPWNYTPPIVLDTSASLALGYHPVGTYAQTIGAQIDWLLQSPAHQPASPDPYYEYFTNYSREDSYLQNHQLPMLG
ncbi:reductase [Arthrobacter sp. MYb227]|uniref:NAD-dependent epimerase/dehydratase family protein n=1 Tax=Arthrobacter sp. MYb227 TaxID=1848601 RepID=UPI000CFC5DE8|nr:NAD-dependent epimerase/dehydratase family protein [Arthrobacter sp. MYb227]PQZ92132.1 reductase [Arthrobacter sp. MYb227]